MTNYSEFEPTPSLPPRQFLPLPLSKPVFTYILLAAIVVIWILMQLAEGSTGEVLVRFGANFGPLILQGETWRLFTSMFLHVNLVHLFFNCMALYALGLEMESLYGPDRYIVIYLLSGLFGSLASFAGRGPAVFSAGASGAIFGIIGMNLAYFLLHRESFGQFGRQRLMSTLLTIGFNLLFGFTVTGIDNLAHLGGLVAGFALGYPLAPRYQVIDQYTSNPRVVDTVSLLKRWWVPALGVFILGVGVPLTVSFWSS
jgi:rhomboid protease GluP